MASTILKNPSYLPTPILMPISMSSSLWRPSTAQSSLPSSRFLSSGTGRASSTNTSFLKKLEKAHKVATKNAFEGPALKTITLYEHPRFEDVESRSVLGIHATMTPEDLINQVKGDPDGTFTCRKSKTDPHGEHGLFVHRLPYATSAHDKIEEGLRLSYKYSSDPKFGHLVVAGDALNQDDPDSDVNAASHCAPYFSAGTKLTLLKVVKVTNTDEIEAYQKQSVSKKLGGYLNTFIEALKETE